jgi:hypothetical protein
MTYDIGDRVRLTCQFATVDRIEVDPTQIIVSIKPPSMPSVSYSWNTSPAIVNRLDVGLYYIDIDVFKGGTWRYKWTGTGALTVVEESQIFVRSSRV